jgi:hypothetical protein
MKNFLFHLTVLGFCLANLFSCTNPLETGSELLDNDLINVQNIDTFKITSTTIPGDSLLVYSIPTTASSGLINRYFFGKLNDPIFGLTDVVLQSQLVPVVQLHPGLKIQVDSLVLVLPYSKDYLYGNKAQQFDLEIRELADSFKLDVNYFSNQKIAAKSSVVFGTSFVPNLDSVKIIDLSIGAKTQLKLPAPSVLNTYSFVPPVIFTLPTAPNDTLLAPVKLIVPLLVRFDSVPTDVIFGCAFVYTVPDNSALPT